MFFVQLKYCEACLILANRNCDDPDEQDSANIMRATSVKNYNPHIRVIIQLLQQHNKVRRIPELNRQHSGQMSQNIKTEMTIEMQLVRSTKVCGKVLSKRNGYKSVKQHCYCPMLLMGTTKTAVCLQTKAIFHYHYGF